MSNGPVKSLLAKRLRFFVLRPLHCSVAGHGTFGHSHRTPHSNDNSDTDYDCENDIHFPTLSLSLHRHGLSSADGIQDARGDFLRHLRLVQVSIGAQFGPHHRSRFYNF
jgi:hypothetical protein